MLDPWDPQVQILTQAIRETPLEQLQTIVKQLIPLVLMPSAEFLNALSPNERAIALRACLIVFILSESTIPIKQNDLPSSIIHDHV